MPYVPRPPMTTACAHCQTPFESRHRRRKYCCNSCNVLAAQARKKAPAAAPPGAEDPAFYAVPAHIAGALGPIEPVGTCFYVAFAGAPSVPAHRFRSTRPVAWHTAEGESFPRAEFALSADGGIWLQSYGHEEERWFRVETIRDPPGS